MSVCSDFTQNAWKKDLCVNCQRPRSEHVTTEETAKKGAESGTDSPKPAKRNSLMTKSWTVLDPEAGKHERTEEDQWNAMCLPDPSKPDKRLDDTDQCISKPLVDTDFKQYPEHSYEDIDSVKGQSSKNVISKNSKTVTVIPVGETKDNSRTETGNSRTETGNSRTETGNSRTKNVNSGTETENKSNTKTFLTPEDRLNSLITESKQDKDSKSRSRSSSREKSPIPAPKPKLFDKPNLSDSSKTSHNVKPSDNVKHTDNVKHADNVKHTDNIVSDGKLSPRSRKKLKKGERCISFKEDAPSVIGDDGGLDNLYSDTEDITEEPNEAKEIMNFTENEKEWALQALKNTLWNTDHVSASEDLPDKHSKEYEDLDMESLWKPDRFANTRECDPLPDTSSQNFGTFPLRTKTEKTVMDNMFSSNRLSTLDESSENVGEESPEDKYEAVLKFLGADKIDFSMSPKHKNLLKCDVNVSDGGDGSDPSYDDPWEGKFGFESESEMNLFDEIKSEIDLDSSTAGFALVDLLNDVLSKYSTGTPSETDSVKNLDTLDEDGRVDKNDGKDKPTELEAKMVTLAASLRKQRAKGRAPRPPSCPPEPPQEPAKSPQKQLELRAAQSKEPTFKMVTLNKQIGGNPLSQPSPAPSSAPTSLPAPAPGKTELSGSTSSGNSVENMEGYKVKTDKQTKKSGGGIGGFFSRILRRGRDSESDITASSETLVSNSGSQSDVQSDTESQSDKGGNFERQGSGRGDSTKKDKRTSKSSPQMKLKVLPTRPVSPRPPDRPPQPDLKKDPEKDVKPSPKASPKPEPKVKENKDNKPKVDKANIDKANIDKANIDIGSSENSSSQPEPSQLSPSRSSELATTSRSSELATSPKSKEAPPLPLNPPRDVVDSAAPPKPRARGNSEGGAPRSRPRTRDSFGARDTPNVPPPKPPVAVKPRPAAIMTKSMELADSSGKIASPQHKISSSTSLEETSKPVEDKKPDPKILRKRAKSPKRTVAPIAPGRASLPNVLADSSTSLASNISDNSTQSVGDSKTEQPKALTFAKELELKLNKDPVSSTPASGETRKLSAPPPLPTTAPKIDYSEKCKTLPADCRKKDKDISKTNLKDAERAKSASKDDLKTSPPSSDDKTKLNVPDDAAQKTSPNTSQAAVPPMEMPAQPEKIELPKPAGNSRKSFLGKLNRKNKPPAPAASVKRTKSITESHVLSDHTGKKIDLKDISGPVLITEMSSNKAVSRRNTISLGDDNSFLSGGSTSSGSTSGDKSDISPRGSVENLYEFIKSEAPQPPVSDKKNLYDPVVEGAVIGLRPPSMTGSEGYLEPIKSAGGLLQDPVSSNMAESTTSMGSMTTSIVAMVNNNSTMSTSTVESFQAPSDVNEAALDDLDVSPERRELLASQPIYEEITNGYGGKYGTSQGENVTQSGDHSNDIPDEIYGVHDTNINNGDCSKTELKSKDSFSSESDLSSANNSLSRPRPIPRKRPRHVGSGFEQYVAMNRPSVAVFLNEEQLREMLSTLTAMNLNTLREIYTQHEKCFTKESLQLGLVGPLKWHDFDIYGKPLHTSEKSVVYNAKMRNTMSPCQLMLLHSRPEITAANHPSLLKPTCIFTDCIPYSYLTDAFIKTSQILETTVSQSNASFAKCYIVVGLFDITESLNAHMNAMETICENQKDFLRKVLFFVLQLLSAISHCLEQGHPLSEADFRDLYLISNPYCLGETVSFLPQVRAPEDQQIDRVCLFLERFLIDMSAKCDANSVLDDVAFFTYAGVQKVIELLESGVAECLPVVRSYTEFLLWGPGEQDPEFEDYRHSNLEPQLSMWLEKQRADLIHDFARRIQHGAQCNIKDFYKMKFLLKASSGSLAECIRCHASAPSS